MGRIRTTVEIDASPETVWEELRHVERHVDWMLDAEAIRFTSQKHEGKGVTFECDTRFGPLKLTDLMEVTEWKPGRAMGVRHVGLVTGTGTFKLKAARRSKGTRTKVTWEERLKFPWWLGGPVGAMAGRPIMGAVWRKNLSKLKAVVEQGDNFAK